MEPQGTSGRQQETSHLSKVSFTHHSFSPPLMNLANHNELLWCPEMRKEMGKVQNSKKKVWLGDLLSCPSD